MIPKNSAPRAYFSRHPRIGPVGAENFSLLLIPLVIQNLTVLLVCLAIIATLTFLERKGIKVSQIWRIAVRRATGGVTGNRPLTRRKYRI